jgi:hypothetical protein
VFGEILAIVGLGLAAPAAYTAGRGEWSNRALVLWALCALFFVSSVLRVKTRVLAAQPRRACARRALQRASIAYHLGLVFLILAAAAGGWLPPLAAIAFAPVLASAVAGLHVRSGRPNLVRAGLFEVVFSLWFLGCTVAALR